MLEFFEVSRCSSYDNYMLTCLFLDKKTNEGNLSLFRSGDVVPSYQKNIKKAEEIKVRFSPCSNQFLM